LGGDNIANVQRLTIVADPANANGSAFGGIRAGNAAFVGSQGVVGISAANVAVQDVVTIGDIYATDSASPSLAFGSNSQFGNVTVAGGDLLQGNSKTINNAGYKYDVVLAAGTTSGGAAIEASNTYGKLSFLQTPASVAAALPAPTPTAKIFTLTAGVDRLADFTGTAANDSFIGNTSAGNVALTALDAIDGGAGTDTFTISATGLIDTTAATGATVANIEVVELVSTAGVTANTAAWTGVTTLTVAGRDASAITASQSTDVTVTLAGLAVTDTVDVVGGRNVILNSTVAATAANGTSALVVVGGTSTKAPTGTVTVTQTENVTDDTGAKTHTTGTIAVTGGQTITVNSLATGGAHDNAGDVITIGAITVTGSSLTTNVSVTQSVERGASTGGTAMGITNGNVTITDSNATSASDTITSVTLAEYGAATISSTVLTNLTLNGTSGANTTPGTVTLNQTTADKSTPATALTVNLVGGSVGTIGGTQANAYSTVEFNTTAASTVGAVSFAKATAINFTGTAGVTVTTPTDIAATKTIANNGSSDVTLSFTLAETVLYTGGAGKDAITVGATKQAITTGAGDDTVTIGASALGLGGSIDGGDGNDTLVMSMGNATTASATATFETSIAGFERLSISDAPNSPNEIKLNNLDDINYVAIAGVDAGDTLTLSGASSGFTLVANSGAAGIVAVQLANNGTADVANVAIAADGGQNIAGLDLSGFETINFTTIETAVNAAASGTDTHSVTLTAASATTIVASGSAGLGLGAGFIGTALTRLDASAVTAGPVTYTTAALAGAATLLGGAGGDALDASSAAASVSIDGGAGNDTITGPSGFASTLVGGSGNDILKGGAAADVIDGGTGVDRLDATLEEQAGSGTTDGVVVNLSDAVITQSTVFSVIGKYLSASAPTVAANTSTYVFHNESTTNAVVVDTLSNIEDVTGTNGADYLVGSAVANSLSGLGGDDALVAGEGADTLSGGAGADSLRLVETVRAADVITLSAVATGGAASSESARVAVANNGDDIGQDVITGFNIADDTIVITATEVKDFEASTDLAMGLAGNANNGSQASFTTNTLIVSLSNAVGGTLGGDAGDVVLTFSGTRNGDAALAAPTAAELGGRISYRLTGTTGTDTISGGPLADVITGGGDADSLTGGDGVDTFTIPTGDSSATYTLVAGRAAAITGMDEVADFALAGGDVLNLDGSGRIAANTTGVNGVDSTGVLTAAGADVIKSHAISSGIITFDDDDAFAGAVTLSDVGDVATALDYLLKQDLGDAGVTVAFVAGTDTYVYQQKTTDAGGSGSGGYSLIKLTGKVATSLMTTGTTSGGIRIG
jgi:S-layer protein